MNVHTVHAELAALANPDDAIFLQRYFKTAPGQYGDGDRFLGIRVPVLRTLVRKYERLELNECVELLHSEYHEARLLALLILVRKYDRGDEAMRAGIYSSYLDNTAYINNWDLVDSSAPQIVGRHLQTRDRSILDKLAGSELLWERRIAILATQTFIKAGQFDDTFRVAGLLIADEEDLIHKAVGWMLREVANRDMAAAQAFLAPRYNRMPRTMLRYAIEKFPEALRKRYLQGTIKEVLP